MAGRLSRKEILDALTCDSSIEGCDPDWRREVISNASKEDIDWVQDALNLGKLPNEIESEIFW